MGKLLTLKHLFEESIKDSQKQSARNIYLQTPKTNFAVFKEQCHKGQKISEAIFSWFRFLKKAIEKTVIISALASTHVAGEAV